MAEKAEEFNFGVDWDRYMSPRYKALLIENTILNVNVGIINQGEEKEFTLENSPLVYNYIITYSTTNDFSTYSTLNTTLFVAKIAGLYHQYPDIIWLKDEDMKLHIENYNHHTICGSIKFMK